MKEIPLTQGKVAIVDDEDYPALARHKWYALRVGRTFYAARNDGPYKHQRKVLMHREILNPPADMEVDHRDGDGLNNCRSNLRVVTHRQNGSNIRKRAGKTTSQYKGVYRETGHAKWLAKINVCGKSRYLGTFGDEHSAALAYDAAARELFGEFARLNFPA